ncbi:MAG: hypothetical protein H6807_03410 [Planctomycetes bacterium]|nr:hypothetical protein [Planctomycetota bacterium]
MGNKILKVVLSLLLLGNIAWLGWNAVLFFDDLASTQEQAEKAPEILAKIERRRQFMKNDLDLIVQNKYVKVKDVNVALQDRLEAVGIRPLDDGVAVPPEPKNGLAGGRAYDEQVWKITFNNREKMFSARNLARFCVLVEKDMPGYQLKTIDLGQRQKQWGTDLWKPVAIEIRRLTRREKR